MIVVPKAFAYVTRGNKLLVFTQPDFPEAGVQVPTGTIGEALTIYADIDKPPRPRHHPVP